MLSMPSAIGHGRVWNEMLRELRRLARVDTSPRRADAWLIDGHHGPVDTDLPVVAQVHETPWRIPEVAESLDPRFIELVGERTRAAARRADRIVTASQVTRAQIAEVCEVDPERIDVVPHGVDAALFTPERRGSPRARPYVLFAASVHPRKNLSALREAIAALAAQGFPHALVVVAAPALDRHDSSDLERAAFAELPGAPGRIERVERPSDEELAALMAGADAFVLPSLYEGFGLTALEAMACGAPTVVAARGALPEVVGAAGITCEPTAAGIEEALARVLSDSGLAARLRAAGRERAVAMSWEASARGYLASVERAIRVRAS